MLVDHADPVVDGVVHTGELHLLAAHADRSGIGLVEPEDDVHERALSGAVLAEEAVDLALIEREVDVLVGDHARERLGHTAHFEDRDLVISARQ